MMSIAFRQLQWKKLLFILGMLFVFSAAAAQGGDEPHSVAILRFGPEPTDAVLNAGFLDFLQAAEVINDQERALLDAGEDIANDVLELVWQDAGYDFPTAGTMIDAALEQEFDVLLTLSTPITQIAIHATREMTDPPIILFTDVYNPHDSGIAESACSKPPHVTGVGVGIPYQEIMAILQLQSPDLQVIGTIYDSSDPSGSAGAAKIIEYGEELGWTVEAAAVSTLPDLAAAAAGLIERGIEALVLPIDATITRGLPILVSAANEGDIPIVYSGAEGVFGGATINIGPALWYERGASLAQFLVAHLDGRSEIANTAIPVITHRTLSLNLDSAKAQNFEVAPALIDAAVLIIEDGQIVIPQAALEQTDPPLSLHLLLGIDSDYEASPGLVAQLDAMEMPEASHGIADFDEFLSRFDCSPSAG